MRKKGLILAVLAVLMLAGCGTTEESEERKLPTLAPNGVEDGSTEQKEDKSGGFSSLLSYVDQSRQAADENTAISVKSVILVACADAMKEGMVFPTEPIRFRYTKDLDEIDDNYSILKERIIEILGEEGAELCVKGNYMMIEISADEGGKPKVEVELLNE